MGAGRILSKEAQKKALEKPHDLDFALHSFSFFCNCMRDFNHATHMPKVARESRDVTGYVLKNVCLLLRAKRVHFIDNNSPTVNVHQS